MIRERYRRWRRFLGTARVGPLPVLVARKILARLRSGGPVDVLRWVSAVWGELGKDVSYPGWLKAHRLTSADVALIRAEVARPNSRPTLSLLTRVHTADPARLTACINSVAAQYYPHWQLCMCDDGSTRAETRDVLRRYESSDPRIVVARPSPLRGISDALNAALALSAGEYIALLDEGDVIQPDALFDVAWELGGDPTIDFIYTDEDEIDRNGRRNRPFFKPDWSPDLLLSKNYIGRLAVIRRGLVEEVGGFRGDFDGSEDYDLYLRVLERTTRIRHVAKPLYSRRTDPASPTGPGMPTQRVHEAGRRALEDALRRRGMRAAVEDGALFRYRVRYAVRGDPMVSIIIPTRNQKALLERCVNSLETRTAYRNFEIIIADNRSTDPATLAYLAHSPHRVVRIDEPFNYSRINNIASRQATGEILVLLNNDTEVIEDEWLAAMVEHAVRPEVGVVGAKLLYPDGTVQHGGVIIGSGGFARHAFRHLPKDAPGYRDLAVVIRNTSAVTAACLAIRRGVFDEVGGFDEDVAVAFGDVDLCLRIRAKGYRIVWTPYALLYHHEGASRGTLHPANDEARVRTRWRSFLEAGDPYHNSNLSAAGFDFGLGP